MKSVYFDKLKDKKNILKSPSIEDLEKFLEKNTDKYDKGLKKVKELDSNLISIGLTDSGPKEYYNETENQRKKRIKRIQKSHSELIKTLEENKHLEKKIKFIHKKLHEQIIARRNKQYTNL